MEIGHGFPLSACLLVFSDTSEDMLQNVVDDIILLELKAMDKITPTPSNSNDDNIVYYFHG